MCIRDRNINNIAVASSEIFSPDVSVCNKYYYLGNQEIKWKFPFSLKLITQKEQSGIKVDIMQNNQTAHAKSSEYLLKRIQNKVITMTGILHRRRAVSYTHLDVYKRQTYGCSYYGRFS